MTLKLLMQTPLPPIRYQKRLMYKTTAEEVSELYHLINNTLFENKLSIPTIILKDRTRDYIGKCYGYKSRCTIVLISKWYCVQWLIMILAHEMSHQYQWEVLGTERESLGKDKLMSHGSSFFIHQPKFKEHGLPLRKTYKKAAWLETQNIFKC